MKERIIVAAIFVPVLFVVLFFLPPYALAAVVAIICAISAYELLCAIAGKANKRIRVYAVVSAALIPAGVYFGHGAMVFKAVFLLLMCIMFIEAVAVFKTDRQITVAQILVTLFGGALIPYFLSSLIGLKLMPEGRLFVLLPVICAFVTDGGAYFAGYFFGSRRAFPTVSPKKTVEGCIGGIAVGTAAMVIYGIVLSRMTLYDIRFWALIIYGVVGGAATELGDLAFSLIKREYDIKDYGTLLPGHGGILDRFDSMVFAAPAIFLLVSIIPAIIIY